MVAAQARAVYLDASALVKLVITEPESAALRVFLSARPVILSSRISSVEVRRVARRQTEQNADEAVDALLEGVRLIELDAAMAREAGIASPSSLRSLDAIHLASALSLGEELEAVVTYDHRLAEAAQKAGLAVETPTG